MKLNRFWSSYDCGGSGPGEGPLAAFSQHSSSNGIILGRPNQLYQPIIAVWRRCRRRRRGRLFWRWIGTFDTPMIGDFAVFKGLSDPYVAIKKRLAYVLYWNTIIHLEERIGPSDIGDGMRIRTLISSEPTLVVVWVCPSKMLARVCAQLFYQDWWRLTRSLRHRRDFGETSGKSGFVILLWFLQIRPCWNGNVPESPTRMNRRLQARRRFDPLSFRLPRRAFRPSGRP